MENQTDKISPMMAQYQQIKNQNPDALIFFRLGDFYELFGEDAKEASRLLDITLTARTSGEGRTIKVPMCGVPYHAVESYLNRLLKAGRKVAIVEQMEDPRKTKGMVRRELVRIITPGTILSPESLAPKQNNYLAAVTGNNHQWGFAAVDISTGEFLVSEFKDKQGSSELLDEFCRLPVAELLIPDSLSADMIDRFLKIDSIYISRLAGHRFDPEAGKIRLAEHFGPHALSGFGCGDLTLGLGAAAAALDYLSETQRGVLNHIRKLTPYYITTHMILDESTIKNLELSRNQKDGTQKNTLLHCLDYTLTAMGGRRIYRWILRPLIQLEEIELRQSAVLELTQTIIRRQNLAQVLSQMHDLERLVGRIGSGTANPRDLIALKSTLELIPPLKRHLADVKSQILAKAELQIPECSSVQQLISKSIMDEPPVTIKEGNIIRDGFYPEVDELRSLSKEAKQYMMHLQTRERERTGIASLKVEFNSVFGYYIEVSKANTKLVPEDYQRKQTLVNAERYITPELKEYEQKVLSAQDRLMELEQDLFLKIRSQISGQLQEMLQAADFIAEIDTVLSLAEAAIRHHYVRPQINPSGQIIIREGRHPVIERLTPDKFVPNDVFLDLDQNQILIITGPNMSGKSTFLRQVALITIMSQMGSFVPASEAQIGLVDRVFTRVGAADNLAGGQSTFMVEMNETANILNNATSQSLIILDEVGRGTSTFDGVSIAWAVAEYLHDQVRSKTLFATHYFELTELALSKEKIKNFNIAVREWKEEIIFLRKIVEGSTDRSYGIQVARLAGLPAEVIQRAKEILSNLEQANYLENGKSRLAIHHSSELNQSRQGSFFTDSQYTEIISSLSRIELDKITPLEALNYLAALRKKYLP